MSKRPWWMIALDFAVGLICVGAAVSGAMLVASALVLLLLNLLFGW